MSVAHPLAQAVLGLALLGHVVRLLAAAVNDGKPTPTPSQLQPAPATLAWPGSATGGGVLPGGDIGGDAQLDESFSVRFCHRDHAGALVIVYYYAALDLDDLTTVYVERQTELLACSDPDDPGGTEVWSDDRYATVARGFASVEAATAAARRAAEAHLVCDEVWSGRPPWESEEEGNS